MIQALGYSQTLFDPANPGRLCRGRERWVEGCPLDDDRELVRVVISGASFSDDTARDARRGIAYSGSSAGRLLAALFPGQPLLAFCEQGEPGAVPAGAVAVEMHEQPRYGGRRMDLCARWRAPATDAAACDALIGGGASAAEGILPWAGELSAEAEEALFLLTGQGTTAGFPRRVFQASALPQVLACVPWVALVHLDKHDLALGIYSRAPLDVLTALERAAAEVGALAVPFSIPPMLARWDRALFELRQVWRGPGEFPVPPGELRCPPYQRQEREEEEVEE